MLVSSLITFIIKAFSTFVKFVHETNSGSNENQPWLCLLRGLLLVCHGFFLRLWGQNRGSGWKHHWLCQTTVCHLKMKKWPILPNIKNDAHLSQCNNFTLLWPFTIGLRSGNPTSEFLTLTASRCTWWGDPAVGAVRTASVRTISTSP